MSDYRLPVTAREASDPRGWPTAWITAVGLVLTFVVVVLLQVLYYRTQQREFERKVVAAPAQEWDELRRQQTEQLNGYGWIDEEQGIVAIPIEDAMKQVVAAERGANDPR